MKSKKIILSMLVLVLLMTIILAGTVFAAPPYVTYLCSSVSDITDALASADNEIEIVLMADIPVGDVTGSSGFEIPAGKDVIFDLNGFDVTAGRTEYMSSQLILNKGTLTLQDTSSTDPEQWGTMEMGSTAYGVEEHTSGSYVVNNVSGTVTFKSGRYINLGGADVPYVFNNMSSPAGGTVTVNVEGGYLESVENDVFRMYEQTTSATNTVNISGGTLVGAGRVGWIQAERSVASSLGSFTINITGGELLVSTENTNFCRSVIEVYYYYKEDAQYAPVNINISDGLLYSRRGLKDSPSGFIYPTISFVMSGGGTNSQRSAHALIAPLNLVITGGTFDNSPGGRNVNHSTFANSAFASDSVKVSAGNFTYDPKPYIQGGSTVPTANYRPAGGQEWFYVTSDYISAGLANAGDGNSTPGIDAFEFLRGDYVVDATRLNNTVKSDVNMIVNAVATVEITTNGTLTNNGLITNNGVITTDGGLLQNNTLIVNNNEFYHLSGSVDGTTDAKITHGAAAETDADDDLTVFFLVHESDPYVPEIADEVAGLTYVYDYNNHWIRRTYDDSVTFNLSSGTVGAHDMTQAGVIDSGGILSQPTAWYTGQPQHMTTLWYDNPSYTGDPWDFENDVVTGKIDLYAYDNVADNQGSLQRAFDFAPFTTILIRGESSNTVELTDTITSWATRTVNDGTVTLKAFDALVGNYILSPNKAARHIAVSTAGTFKLNFIDVQLKGRNPDPKIAGTPGGGVSFSNVDSDVTLTAANTISGFSNITDCYVNQDINNGCGGGVYAHGDLLINGIKISNNRAGFAFTGYWESQGLGRGGGIFCDGNVFTMNGGEISGNVAMEYNHGGGGICNESSFTMNGGKIIDNLADFGGGILSFGDVVINDGEISGNEAYYGGGVYFIGSYFDTAFRMNGGKITDNEAEERGGAVYSDHAEIFIMTDGEISGNISGYKGGAIYFSIPNKDAINNIQFLGGKITGNYADYDGGAMYVDCNMGVLILNGIEISGNEAGNDGGAIFSESVLNITNSLISGNTAGRDGGAIYTTYNVGTYYGDGIVIMNSGEIVDNTAGRNGGGIYSNGMVTVDGGEISGNTAGLDGGGIFTCKYENLFIDASVDFYDNTAATYTVWLVSGAADDAWSVIRAIYRAQNPGFPTESQISSISGETLGELGSYDNLYNNYDINFKTVNVIYAANYVGASPATVVKAYILGEPCPVIGNMFPLPGSNYAFKEWNTLPDGTGTSYLPGSTISTTTSVTLYAQWTQIPTPPGPVDPPVTPPPPPPPFFIEEHPAYIIGYPDGEVKPGNNISRAEVATVFFRLLTEKVRNDNWKVTNDFPDALDGIWYNNAVSTISNMGIITGYPDGTFRPSASITRGELAAIAARFADQMGSVETNQRTFSDIDGHWAEEYILKAASVGWIKGHDDGTFRPNDPITRAEFMTLANRMLERAPELVSDIILEADGEEAEWLRVWSDNANKNAWYYLDVQEATNSHDYIRKEDNFVPDLNFEYETWVALLPPRDWAALEK